MNLSTHFPFKNHSFNHSSRARVGLKGIPKYKTETGKQKLPRQYGKRNNFRLLRENREKECHKTLEEEEDALRTNEMTKLNMYKQCSTRVSTANLSFVKFEIISMNFEILKIIRLIYKFRKEYFALRS